MGLFIALLIMLLWLGNLVYSLLYVDPVFSSPWLWVHFLVQIYLYTGLFITAHDAMHGQVTRNRKINNAIGHLATTFYAFLSFQVLSQKHYQHHRFPGTEKDPDFSSRSNNFFIWWYVFMKNYIRWWQIVLMAVAFNILLIWFSEVQLLLFWVVPVILSTFQLFYFGTYRPHRRPFKPEMEPHNSRSQRRNHFWAMISCYFFGYHWEHHESPATPWWRLYRVKRVSPR